MDAARTTETVERQTNRELAEPLSHATCEHSIQPDSGERERDQPERAPECGSDAVRIQHDVQMLAHRASFEHCHVRIQLADDAPQLVRCPSGVTAHPDHQAQQTGVPPRQWLIHERLRFFAECLHFDVGCHADDVRPRRCGADPDSPANGIGAGPVTAGGGGTDDQGRRTGLPIGVIERAAPEQRHTHCVEISLTDAGDLHAASLGVVDCQVVDWLP